MHELSITQSLLNLALRHAAEAGGSRILAINLTIGELSPIVDDSVQFYWDIISEGTIAAGAQLHFKRVQARMRCEKCGQEFSLDRESFLCPFCAGTHIAPCAGTEFLLDSIRIEGPGDLTNDSRSEHSRYQEPA